VRFPRGVKLYVGAVVLLAVLALAYALSLWHTPNPTRILLFCVFALLAGLAELYATLIPPFEMDLSSSIAIYLAALFSLGLPMTAILVTLTTGLSELMLRRERRAEGWGSYLTPVIFNVGQVITALTASGVLLHLLGYRRLSLIHWREYPVAISSFLLYLLVNHGLVTGIVVLRERHGFFSALSKSITSFSIQYAALCMAALILTVLYSVSVWHVILALFPLSLIHVSFRGWVRLRTETRKTFEKLSRLLDERDHYTAVHSLEVADVARKVGRDLGLSREQLESLDVAARVHDIGKVSIPDAILLKPGPLTVTEMNTMRRHPSISADLIEGLEIYSSVVEVVRHEHEHWDGTGYPAGLAGEEIPLLSRVIAAADIYDALSTDRPYRKAFRPEVVREMIAEMRGKELDPRIGDALLRVLAAEDAAAGDAPIAGGEAEG